MRAAAVSGGGPSCGSLDGLGREGLELGDQLAQAPGGAYLARRVRRELAEDLLGEEWVAALLRSLADNYVWNNSVDALSAGAGNPAVRAGVVRLLSTISGVRIAHSAAGGQPALTLTAGPEVFGGEGEQVLTVNAKTGMPVTSVQPAEGKVRGSVDTFRVLRVTLAEAEAGKF